MSKLLDKQTPTVNDLAKKYNVSAVVVKKQLMHGIKVEKEHTNNAKIAREIALDHLGEKLDYYKKLSKIEEETGVGGIRGLGYVSGDPAGTNYVQSYIDTNAMSYVDENGNKLNYIKKAHADLHNKGLGYNFFNPTEIKSSSNFMNESIGLSQYGKLNELGGSGEPDGYVGLSDPSPKMRKDVQVEGQKMNKAKKIAMAGLTASNLYTLGDVTSRAIEGHRGSPKGDVVRVASALPGTAGWGATGVYYAKKAYDYVKRKKMNEETEVNEDLRKWFKEKWVRYDTKGNIKGPCAREEGEGKPKCRPLASARAMSKDERAKSARRKRREDPVADRPGKGGKPIMVNTHEETLLEKNVPTNPALWARAKAQARAKFDVYPSAYANGWASKWYKSKGGGWKSSKSVDEACWDGYQAKGMKKKGSKMVPNCVPVSEQGSSATRYTERPTYEDNNKYPDTAERGIYQEDWQSVNRHDKTDGLSQKAVNAYRREHPGSKLKTAVTEKNPTGKRASRRKSFCSRMSGMKKRLTSAKTARDPDSRINKALRRWNCHEETQIDEMKSSRNPSRAYAIRSSANAKYEPDEIAKKYPNWTGFSSDKENAELKARRIAADAESRRRYDEKHGKKEKLDETSLKKKITYAVRAAGQQSRIAKELRPNEVESDKTYQKRKKGLDKVFKESSQLDEISAELVGKVSNARFWRGEAPSKTLSRAINKKFIESGKKKDNTQKSQIQKESGSQDKDWDESQAPFREQRDAHIHLNKPDVKYAPGATGTTHTVYEETKMENQNPIINEAIENIMDDNLVAMKENFMFALQEKVIEKLEERKKDIAASYFAQ